ncbi:glycoside hydrolase family protein [Saccharomonospora saliphila]|uniref:family 43 glycosylhydrolase n=1 Tax=Saccharomonospora saliphila TaxID=369829 RepID=UPI0003738796|nr:family 43 glycosylhydrolase [Saccharomonospora saliphila]
MLRLPDAWTWDFWIADDGETYHLFYLKASRALGDPERRHWNAAIGHAVSGDLTTWEEVADALVPSEAGAFDDLSTWTGSIVRTGDGTWAMFYTGAGSAEGGLKQRIGLATSADLDTWHRVPGPVAEADPAWYETLPDIEWHDEAWRDPWVFADPGGDGWHMLITARAADGPGDERGVLGHAVSPDLRTWRVRPPLSRPGSGFGHLEVPQVEIVDGRAVLLFSCLGAQLAHGRAERGERGGTWCVPVDSPTGPFDVTRAERLTDESLYSGRLVRARDGRWMFLAFRNAGPDGRFVGEVTDPVPVRWAEDGSRLVLDGDAVPSAR